MSERQERSGGAPDDADVLWPPTWQGLKQQIIYLAQFGNSVQIIHGEAGAGKTTFYENLLHSGIGTSALGVAVHKGAGLDVFFHSVLTQLGLRADPGATTGELIAGLRSFVQTLQKERSRLVLLVDDADTLSDSELGALVSLLQGNSDAGVGLHMVLFAEPGFAARVDALNVLDVTVHDAPLPPLSPSEVHTLLKLLGPRYEATVDSPEQAQRLWNQSRGLPGKVLSLVEKLQPATTTEKVLSMRGLPVGHFAALILLSGVLIWAFLVRNPEHPPQSQTTPAVIPADRLPASPPITTEVTPTPPEDSSFESETPIVEQPAPPNPGAVQSQADAVPTPEVDLPAPPGAPASEEHLTQDSAGANFDEPESATAIPSPAEAIENKPVESSDVPTPPPSSPTTVSRADMLAAGEQQLLRYPAEGFVLQLMATSTEEKLKTYAAQQPNRKNLLLYRTTRGGKTLYILVEGFYADKTSALAAIANLPEHQRKVGPWPKKLELIHKEIRANGPI